ncbi:arylacetamide deacetylase-like 4 [Notechis scutatus]|uniref:Arylacetamide deacetylase-like 4 n=1 Tax=Notechis scutatus TaxID=8663 RepID=A0A6J1VDH9_9SAUR|nr:arylacetamide deacetylase-like 4 [Notechis scutatus]
MGFPQALLALLGAAGLAALILLVLGSIYFEATNSELPAGLEQPARLRVIHACRIGAAVLGRILENLHFCRQIQFVRLVRNAWTRRRDPALHIQDAAFEGIPVRLYLPKAPSAAGPRKGIVYFHAGGWLFGSLGSQEHLCCYLARESDSVVVSVAYRLAPEHRHPAQLNDCLAASTHFLKVAEDYGVDSSQVILAGNEAGGNLAARVCQILASRPGPAKVHAQILLCPILQAVDFNLPSYQQNRAVPLLFRERAAFYLLQRLTGDASCLGDILEGSHVPMKLRAQYRKWLSVDHLQEEFKARGYKPTSCLSFKEDVCEALGSLTLPECSPLLAEEAVLSLLPETFILTCEYDVLRDDGLLYKKRLEDQRVPVTWCHLANGFHGIIEFFESSWLGFPSGKKGVDDIVSFIKGL